MSANPHLEPIAVAPSVDSVEVAVLDRDGVILAVNEAWREFCELNSGVAGRCGVGVSYLEACDSAGDAQSARIASAIRDAGAGRLLQPVTVTIPCANRGPAAWFEVSVAPRLDDRGEMCGASVTLIPVAEPRVAQRRASPLSEDVLDDLSVWELLEAAPDGMVLVDGDGLISYVNRQLESMAGYERSSLLGRELEILVPESARRRHHQLHDCYRASPRVRMMGAGVELELRRADGTTMPVEISLAPVQIGSAVMTSASVRDVTIQRAADHDRQRLLRLLDLDPDSVYVIDAGTARIEYANSGAAALLGYSRDELTSMTLYDVSPSATDTRRKALLAEHVQAGPGHRHTLQVIRRTKGGTDIPCDSHGQLVANDGDPKFVLVDRDARPRLLVERLKSRQAGLTELERNMTAIVLADAGSAALYQELAKGVARLLEADNAVIALRETVLNRFTVAATFGPPDGMLFDGQGRLSQDVLARWSGIKGTGLDGQLVSALPADVRSSVGGIAGARFPLNGPLLGLLVALRAPGSAPFDDTDHDLLTQISQQVATVVELGRARADQHQLALAEDRERIARDLHDTVIQDIIGMGLQIANRLPFVEPEQSLRDGELLDRLDEVVRRLRTVVFGRRNHISSSTTYRVVEQMLAEAARVLGHQPRLLADESINDLPSAVTEQLIPALREALSNVARHARATATSVSIAIERPFVTLVVDDNGVGPSEESLGGTGLANVQERAALLGGTAALSRQPEGGARLRWTARLPGAGDVLAG